jgi:hypothetical protein
LAARQLEPFIPSQQPNFIEYILIISYIAQVSCDVHQNEKVLGVPVRGYVATVV